MRELWKRMVSVMYSSLEIRINDSISVYKQIHQMCGNNIMAAFNLLIRCFKSGNKLLLCGNGGSAADCQHLATEFMSSGFPAIALTTDTSFLTAHSNDHSFDSVFEKQVRVLGKPGDVLLAISTSGKSRNILYAMRVAFRDGMELITLTGQDGMNWTNPFTSVIDANIKIPSDDTQYIQEAHIMVEHILWELVKDNNA